MAGRCFISYRRHDSGWGAGRICDALAAKLGEQVVFLDVKNLKIGQDFRKAIVDTLNTCEVLLAIIGEDWETITDSTGRRRLDDPNDYVRLEISTGLKRGIPTVPVLLDRAQMPTCASLPEDIRGLASWQALNVRQEKFWIDITALVDYLRDHLFIAPTEEPIALSNSLLASLRLPSLLNPQGITRSIDPSLAAVIWSRLDGGDKHVLSISLYRNNSRLLFDEYCRRYGADPDVKKAIDNYVVAFEKVLLRLQRKRAPGAAITALRQSEAGCVYLFLAHVSQRLS